MIKVEFIFHGIVYYQQHIQETDHREIKGTVLLVHFMIKHKYLMENMLVQSIHITLATEQAWTKNTLVILKCYFFSTKQNSIGKILQEFLYSHMNFLWLSFTFLYILNPPDDTEIAGKDLAPENKKNNLSKMKSQNERSYIRLKLRTNHIRPK